MAARSEQMAYIYIMGTDDGPVKIGHSLDPKRRSKDFKRKGREVFIAGAWPVGATIALAAERYVQWQLREHHIRSEWFNVPLEKAVEAVKRGLGVLDQLDGYDPIPPLDPPGRALRFGEFIQTKFPNGTSDRIAAALCDGEHMAGFIREAVERELKRREKRG